jgi:glycosyltransferase involved in cell wall biosynthesis
MSRRVGGPSSLINRQHRVRTDGSASTQSWIGLPDLAIVVAIGPFDDVAHAENLAATFVAVQQTCRTQLVMVGTGAGRHVVAHHAVEHELETRLLVIDECGGRRRSRLLAGADLVIPAPASSPSALVEVMAAGRALVAPAGPATALLVMPCSGGLLYRPGDASAMTAAVSRLLTETELRRQMGIRARQAAQRLPVKTVIQQWPHDGRQYA